MKKWYDYITAFFIVRSNVKDLKRQLHKKDVWQSYVKEDVMVDYFKWYCKKLSYAKYKTPNLTVDLEFVSQVSEKSRNLHLVPKFYVIQSVNCCERLKMVAMPYDDMAKYTLTSKDKPVLTGEGSLDDCIKEIEEYIKNG